jgi:hypothetical protein
MLNQPEPTLGRKFTPEQSKALCEIYRILLESESKPAAAMHESQKIEKLPPHQNSNTPQEKAGGIQ